MIQIYAPEEAFELLEKYLEKEARLGELVTIYDHLLHKPTSSANTIVIKEGAITFPIDWQNIDPPYLLPESIALSERNLLGIIFAKLHNYEKVHFYLEKYNPGLLKELDFVNRLRQGIEVDVEELQSNYSPFEEYRLMHNQAITRHYQLTNSVEELDRVMYFYGEALQAAVNDEYRAYTGRQFAELQGDLGEANRALRVLEACLNPPLSKDAQVALDQTWYQTALASLSPPYDVLKLNTIKDKLKSVLAHKESQQQVRETGLIYHDAGLIAHYEENWTESLAYFTKSIQILDDENLYELAANTRLKKGIMLFSWAQAGNPQFYRKAAESLQKAVQVYKKEDYPEVFAEIQHYLGMIYAEIPDDIKKKGIWAGVSSTAFQEALQFYTKENYPYEYASICNHYGNALIKYPEAKLSDNLEKALYYFEEALAVRNPNEYPLERSLTLLNSLEAHWHLGNNSDDLDEERFQLMFERAKEIKQICPDQDLVSLAGKHIEKLIQLKATYA